MQRLIVLLAVALVAAPVVAMIGDPSPVESGETIRPPAAFVDPDSAPPPASSAAVAAAADTRPAEDSIFRAAAETAWEYVEDQYQPSTGLVNSVIGYPYATVWDIGSTLAAYHSAHELGLMPTEQFHERTAAALETLRRVALFSGAAFNKNYEIRRGVPAGRSDRETTEGYGWSATDMGRLLVWLKIVALAHPEHAAAAAAVVDRLNFDRMVREGYLWGEDLDSEGRRRIYQEGRLGYEQYAAAGFALWDHFADHALSSRENAEAVEVLGVPLLHDRRSGGHLTSEPFILIGLELGWWSTQWEQLAEQVLAAQEARFVATGQVTIASEDAIPVAPYYFYYYTIHDAGRDFAVLSPDAPGPLTSPRWISTKGAFGWYVLEPGPYTWRALQAVLPAGDPSIGWSSGIFEESGRPTGGQNINTAAVVLEAALSHELRRPLLGAAVSEGTRPRS